MRRLLLVAMSGVVVAACSGASPSDAGTDAGTDGGVDAGPVCTGVPARLTQYTCVEATFPFPISCEATFEATLAKQTANCDAGPGILGYVAEGDCADLRSVSWVYGFPGDTYECFYARDGGVWTGGINFSDRGTFIGGHVGDCTPKPTAACRDGG